MANTIIIYQGDGSTTDFAVPFDYLRKSFVKVLLNSVTELKGGSATDTSADYYFVDATTIRLRKIVPTTAQTITIRRYTSVKERVASFRDGSVLYAKDLDTSQVQAFHIAEEARDVINDALVVDRDDNWDARGKRIVNVGTPVNDSDAVTYGVYKTDALGAFQARVGAERARDRAIEAETSAKKSADNAKLSETNAQASANTAVSASEHAEAVKVENQTILQEAKEIRDENKVLDANTKANADVATTKANEAKLSEDTAAIHKDSARSSADEATKQAELAKTYANMAASGQVNSDWNATSGKAQILNKPDLSKYTTKTELSEAIAPLATSKEVADTASKYLPLIGGTITGAITHTLDIAVNASSTSGNTHILGGTAVGNGGLLALYGVDGPSNYIPGGFLLQSTDGTTSYSLVGDSSGTLKWRSDNIVRSVNNTKADASGNITIKDTDIQNGPFLPLTGGVLHGDLMCDVELNITCTKDSNQHLALSGGPNPGFNAHSGASLHLAGVGHNNTSIPAGDFILVADGGSASYRLQGSHDGTLTWRDQQIIPVAKIYKAPDGSSWYRKYSDGFIEQGGKIRKATTVSSHYGEEVTITFPLPFTTTPISVIHSGSEYVSACGPVKISNTGYVARFLNGSGSSQSMSDFYWFACGY